MENLYEYFENTKGYGVMSTADKEGNVNGAIYARPHVQEDGTLAVIMNNKRTLKNVRENPNAHYLFIEEGGGYKGIRLDLSKTGEEENEAKIEEICRRCYPKELVTGPRAVVYFKVDGQRPLVGSGEK